MKADFRLARRAASIGGVDIAPGTPVMLLNGAANRDPRRFECPAEFRVDRPNSKEHLAFGRGAHSCPGGPRPGPRAESASTGFSIGCRTSGSRRSITGLPAIATSSTNRPGSCVASTTCTSNSRPWSRPDERAGGGGDRGASGIGLGVAQRLAADGNAVALLDRDGPGTERAAAELSDRGFRAVGYEADVADRAALERVFASVRAGLGPVTILVTSAGIESFDAVADISPEKWDHILAVNLTGTFTCMQRPSRT